MLATDPDVSCVPQGQEGTISLGVSNRYFHVHFPLQRSLTRTEYWDRAGGERNIAFQAFCDFRRVKIAYNGLKMGSFHLFVHPKRSSYHFGKTGFRPIFDIFLVPKKPVFKAFWEFWRVKTGHHGLKMGQKHLFEYPKWSRNKFGKNDFGPFLDPQMTPITLP